MKELFEAYLAKFTPGSLVSVQYHVGFFADHASKLDDAINATRDEWVAFRDCVQGHIGEEKADNANKYLAVFVLRLANAINDLDKANQLYRTIREALPEVMNSVIMHVKTEQAAKKNLLLIPLAPSESTDLQCVEKDGCGQSSASTSQSSATSTSTLSQPLLFRTAREIDFTQQDKKEEILHKIWDLNKNLRQCLSKNGILSVDVISKTKQTIITLIAELENRRGHIPRNVSTIQIGGPGDGVVTQHDLVYEFNFCLMQLSSLIKTPPDKDPQFWQEQFDKVGAIIAEINSNITMSSAKSAAKLTQGLA